MPEQVRYRNKGTQSGTGMIRYGIEMSDAGMPTPAAWGLAADAKLCSFDVTSYVYSTSSANPCPARKDVG
jgi:hypothetical protein